MEDLESLNVALLVRYDSATIANSSAFAKAPLVQDSLSGVAGSTTCILGLA